MGLDTSHNCWHGSYSTFMNWRKEIAKHAEIPLQLMEGFYVYSNITWEDYNNLKIECKNDDSPHWAFDLLRGSIGAPLPLKWEAFKPSPLHILLKHSDCDGIIEWKDCEQIAEELEKILPMIPEEEIKTPFNWRDKTQQFIDGLRLAAKNKEDVDFH